MVRNEQKAFPSTERSFPARKTFARKVGFTNKLSFMDKVSNWSNASTLKLPMELLER